MKSQLRRLWADNRRYFLASALLFLGGMLIGYMQSAAVQEMVNQLLGQLKEVVDRIRENGGGAFATFWAIYTNNVISALMMMAMGLFFGVFPIFGMLANGILLGFILSTYSTAGINPLLVFAAGILPHGIFELAAVFFAAGIGIRLGGLVLRSIGLLFQPGKGERVKNDWYDTLKQFPAAVLLVIVLLLVAGVVESVITPMILEAALGEQLEQLRLLK
ncbi:MULTISPECIES: stage II sporulation protein M [Brevibacillus]|uniref:Stage II sporulation protein M n=1 Tax=Brevibacillus invocatus TaxID=173959 RepID=A0A3M8C508_9BACL|nr:MULTISPECIES: stage II sporulation protein M [Brevibacillus]MDH4618883.1 stage II sporulation protein M [Brevibacillus sp. AY1]RNB70734.1 stage II sporulation protein M [Brevibacillus invocatus]